MTEKTYTKNDIKKLVDDLFTNGAGQKAERLVLVGSMGDSLGGWCKEAIIDRIILKLEITNKRRKKI